MPDKPIIFSAPMVRALLDGRKTQTRRVINGTRADALTRGFQGVRLPYAPGDRLWVREACATWEAGHWDAVYRADETAEEWENIRHDMKHGAPWKLHSPIHMPRLASRITLTVTDVRVQRLQEISEADAMAEGADPILVPPDGGSCPHFEGFRELWNSLHGPDAWGKNPWVVALTFTAERRNIDA